MMEIETSISISTRQKQSICFQNDRQPDFHTLQIGMHWLPEHPGNGLDRVYYELAHHLPQVGVGVGGFIVGASGTALNSTSSVHAVAPIHAPLPNRLVAFRRELRQRLLKQDGSVIASHFALYTLPVLDLVRSHSLVTHFHGPWAMESSVEGYGGVNVKVKALVERLTYQRSDRFIVLSSAFRDILCQHYSVSEDHVRIVPGGVQVSRFVTGLTKKEARIHLGWPIDRPILLAVRRLSRRMGLENLIAAMKVVVTHNRDALLMIAGKGSLKEELERRIEVAGLQRNVRLLGFLPEENLPLAYRAADASVVPSVALEGFGLITVESLAAGTPVLVTPVGGLPEVVRDLSEQLILPSSKPEEMGAYLGAVVDGTITLPEAETCEQYARARFDWPVIAAQVRQVYEEVL